MPSAVAELDASRLLRRRLENCLDAVIEGLPDSAKAAALESADPSELFTAIASAIPVFSGTEEDELKEQQLAAVRFKHEMARTAGGLLDSETAMATLGYGTRQALHKAVQERRLLAVDDGGKQKFPKCQFGKDGKVLPGIRAVLAAAPETNGWRILQYLYGREEGLAGARPIDLLASGRGERVERAALFARRLEL